MDLEMYSWFVLNDSIKKKIQRCSSSISLFHNLVVEIPPFGKTFN